MAVFVDIIANPKLTAFFISTPQEQFASSSSLLSSGSVIDHNVAAIVVFVVDIYRRLYTTKPNCSRSVSEVCQKPF